MFHFAPRQPTVRGWFYFISRLEAWKCLVSTGLMKKKTSVGDVALRCWRPQRSKILSVTFKCFIFLLKSRGWLQNLYVFSLRGRMYIDGTSQFSNGGIVPKKNPVLFNRTFKWTLPVKGAGLTQGPPDLLTAWQHWNLTFPARTLLAALVVTPPTRATTRRRHRPKTGLLPVLGEWGFGGGGVTSWRRRAFSTGSWRRWFLPGLLLLPLCAAASCVVVDV